VEGNLRSMVFFEDVLPVYQPPNCRMPSRDIR
jgi:hypothetical protein